MVTRIEIAIREGLDDPRGARVAHEIRTFLGLSVAGVRTREVLRIDADLTPDEQRRVLHELVDPVLQVGAIDRLDTGRFDVAIAVGYKPGVTDPVAKSARVAIEDTLGRELPPWAAVYTSRLYLVDGADRRVAARIASGLLANPVIQTVAVRTWDEWSTSAPDLHVPRVEPHAPRAALAVDLSGSDGDLVRLSREGLLALSLGEMRAIRDQFRAAGQDPRRRALGLGPEPTDAELECLAQTWSEHCKHKIFNARVTYEEPGRPAETIRSLFRDYIRGTTEAIDRRRRDDPEGSWLVSVFHDNAGAVRFDDHVHLVYKVETHNSPSALDPYGGAITGIVGVNRDPFGTGLGCDLLVNVWGYCFAPPNHAGELPKGLLHPRRIRDGVHAGVIDGGNQSGVPYGRGWELFDERFLGKPLVFCGTVGRMPVEVAGRPGERKSLRPGDRIVMTGGRIGADGIHGATFSSAALDESAPVQAVQIGDPITQKRMFDFLLEARDLGLYEAITDNGAGGLSSSVGEMATHSGGARLDLALAPLKYHGLAPWEVLVSEAQERMTLAVSPDHVERFLELARRREVEATVLGEFTADGFFHVTWGETTVAWIPMAFLHGGAPDLALVARWTPPRFPEPAGPAPAALGRVLLALLGRPNVSADEARARHYDHEVKGLSVVKPWIGVGRDVPAEATVFLARHGSLRGFVLSEGVNPFLSDIDTYRMAQSVVDEALRRQLSAGARLDRIALLDNFCWPDPVQSATTPDGAYKMAQLVRACRGLAETCLAYGTPLISGKDSMKNDSVMGGTKISVPPTLLVSAIGQIDDVRDAITLDPKAAGDVVFLLGHTADETGASEYLRWRGEQDRAPRRPGDPQPWVGNKAPRLDAQRAFELYSRFAEATRAGLIRSATTPARGGWACAFARSAMAGNLGLDLDLGGAAVADTLADDALLFAESNARLLATVRPADAERFAALFDGLPCLRAGVVTAAPRLRLVRESRVLVDVEIAALREAYTGAFDDE